MGKPTKFDTPAKMLALKMRVAQGLLRGETIESMSRDLDVSFDLVVSVMDKLTVEWRNDQFEFVDRWKLRLLGELEDLKQELYRRYAGEYDEDDKGRLVQSTEVNTTGARPSTSTTEVRKPVGLELDALREIRAIIADQRKILGVDAPIQTKNFHLVITADQLRALPDDQLDALIAEVGGTKLLEDLQEAEKIEKVEDPSSQEEIE